MFRPEAVEIKDLLTDLDGKDVRLPEDEHFYEIYLELTPRAVAVETIKRLMGSKPISLLRNNFPYTKTLKNLPNVKHYCLWSINGSLNEKEIVESIHDSHRDRIIHSHIQRPCSLSSPHPPEGRDSEGRQSGRTSHPQLHDEPLHSCIFLYGPSL